MNETSAETFWAALSWSRRALLMLTPVLLGMFLWAGSNVGHFGRGFYPMLALLILLTPVWFFSLGETLILASLLLLHRFRGAVSRSGESADLRRWRRNLRFDLCMIGYFAAAFALSFLTDP